MKLDITSFCFYSNALGFGFQEVSETIQYWRDDKYLANFEETDFVHFNQSPFYFETLIKLLTDKKIKFGTFTVGNFTYFVISSEEASKYILSTLNSL